MFNYNSEQKVTMKGSTCLMLLGLVGFLNIYVAARTNIVCPDGFDAVGDGCYLMECTEMDWQEAHEFCKERGAQLVIIDSAEEGKDLQKWLKKHGIEQSFWTGLGGLDDFLDSLEHPANCPIVEFSPRQCRIG